MPARHIILFIFFLITGCASSDSLPDEKTPAEPDDIHLFPDPEIEALLSSYRDSLNEVMDVKVAEVTDTIRFDRPEGALGNIVADALRFRAASELKQFVHVGIISINSFNLYFEPGILTLGDVYEFMPFDNHLVILTVSGEKLGELADQIAAVGGAPVSGLRFRLSDGRAAGVLVNAEVINPARHYLVATSSYMADSGDHFPALLNTLGRQDLNVSLRELYINYFRNKRELYPVTDGRIRQ